MAQFQKITPYLWFDHQAQEAAEYYTSLFPNSKITSVSSMIVEFELSGQKFIALNGGPQFKFTEAISFFVYCEDQKEVDYYWNCLTSEGGEESMCSWCKDKYGLSWQIVPKQLMEYLNSSNRERANNAMQAMLKMKKIIIALLDEAYNA
ncbi:MAG: VOC family protein [Saprospiraceae bacterium]|nr:VOC family protein [Saprospiraceae bacterium]